MNEVEAISLLQFDAAFSEFEDFGLDVAELLAARCFDLLRSSDVAADALVEVIEGLYDLGDVDVQADLAMCFAPEFARRSLELPDDDPGVVVRLGPKARAAVQWNVERIRGHSPD